MVQTRTQSAGSILAWLIVGRQGKSANLLVKTVSYERAKDEESALAFAKTKLKDVDPSTMTFGVAAVMRMEYQTKRNLRAAMEKIGMPPADINEI